MQAELQARPQMGTRHRAELSISGDRAGKLLRPVPEAADPAWLIAKVQTDQLQLAAVMMRAHYPRIHVILALCLPCTCRALCGADAGHSNNSHH